jgi:predicted dehydrogenase
MTQMKKTGKIRWGLMGAGLIVSRWINGARQLEDEMEIAAVASRSKATARGAAERYGIPEALSYEALARREDIDAVYIPVPHPAHRALAQLAMEHGKAVLVEKPAAVNTAEWDAMTACAGENDVFLMEAAWTRFFPLMRKLREWMAGPAGPVRAVNVAFSSRTPADEETLRGRVFNPALAGGGLLDLGVYNLHFCDALFGRAPEAITGYAAMDTDRHRIKVDEQAVYIAKYAGGALAQMASGVRTNMKDTAFVYGTEGYAEIPVFWKPTRMKLITGGREETVAEPVPQRNPAAVDEGFQYEIAHVNDCLRRGLTASPVLPPEATRRVLGEADALRRQWGLIFPFEREEQLGGTEFTGC